MKDKFEHGSFVEQFGLHASRQENGDRTVEVDIERYAKLLDDPSLDEAAKNEVLQTLWEMLMVLSEIGFGLHPMQKVCGLFAEATTESARKGENLLNSNDTERRIE